MGIAIGIINDSGLHYSYGALRTVVRLMAVVPWSEPELSCSSGSSQALFPHQRESLRGEKSMGLDVTAFAISEDLRIVMPLPDVFLSTSMKTSVEVLPFQHQR